MLKGQNILKWAGGDVPVIKGMVHTAAWESWWVTCFCGWEILDALLRLCAPVSSFIKKNTTFCVGLSRGINDLIPLKWLELRLSHKHFFVVCCIELSLKKNLKSLSRTYKFTCSFLNFFQGMWIFILEVLKGIMAHTYYSWIPVFWDCSDVEIEATLKKRGRSADK